MVSFKLFITLLPLALAAVTRVPLVDDLLSEVDNLVVGLVNPDEDIVLDKYIVTLKFCELADPTTATLSPPFPPPPSPTGLWEPSLCMSFST